MTKARVHFQLLGGFNALRDDGRKISLPTRKAEALLAMLAVRPGTLHTREKIAGLLWGSSGPEQARQSLRQTIFGIRRALDTDSEVLIVIDDQLSIDPEAITIDVVQFEQLAASDLRAPLEQAFALYRGEFLDGLDLDETEFDDWWSSQRERIHQTAVRAFSRLLELQDDDGDVNDAILTAMRILELDPLQEAIHRALMRLYLRQGRSEAALKQYQTCAEALRRQLRVEPDSETKALYQTAQLRRNAPEEGAAPPAAGPVTVLLVEDNALHRNLTRAMLQEAKFQVFAVEDGAQALIALGRQHFDIILLDVNLPTISGFELLRIMRANHIDVPAIILTSESGDNAEVEGFDLGASDFIRKPVRKEVLVTRIEKALRDHQARIAAHR
jgi:DNA-binding SARP family transcriptional activator